MRRVMNFIISQDEISAFCERHHIRKLALFGSILRSDFRPDSDIDVLVEFEADRPVTLFDMGAAQVELSELLGREVDLKTAGFLSPYFRQRVIDTAEVIYERS
ncbi:MAG: nucleotidyltransferase family protein [Anaerolineae bacterium]|nr:nucleotidyltransferase family protein [Anaerolineae bacterium]